jgi:hypothetical protein
MNLDQAGTEWYLDIVGRFAGKRTFIICSNLHHTESAFAGKTLQIEQYK